MKIQTRGVNVKRHTIAYKVGGQWRTRKEAVRLARKGRIEGVTTRRGGNDELFLVSLPGHPRLYDLQEKLV